ncbi:uncharacterized protein LOC100430902 [Macaca mulatta]
MGRADLRRWGHCHSGTWLWASPGKSGSSWTWSGGPCTGCDAGELQPPALSGVSSQQTSCDLQFGAGEGAMDGGGRDKDVELPRFPDTSLKKPQRRMENGMKKRLFLFPKTPEAIGGFLLGAPHWHRRNSSQSALTGMHVRQPGG